MNTTVNSLHSMQPIEINQIAYTKLVDLLERCTLNLVTNLTGVTRPTLYRWLDEDRSLEEMDYKQAAWFILVCETSPKVKMLMDRAPLSHRRLAKRLIDEGED